MPIASELSKMPSSSTEQNSAGDSQSLKVTRRKALEIVWPYVVALANASLYHWAWNPLVTATFRDVLSPMSRGAGTVFGFLLSAASLLVAVKGSWYKQRAKEAGVYHRKQHEGRCSIRGSLANLDGRVDCLGEERGG